MRLVNGHDVGAVALRKEFSHHLPPIIGFDRVVKLNASRVEGLLEALSKGARAGAEKLGIVEIKGRGDLERRKGRFELDATSSLERAVFIAAQPWRDQASLSDSVCADGFKEDMVILGIALRDSGCRAEDRGAQLARLQ